MLPVSYLFDRLRYAKSRADELRPLRTALRNAPGASEVSFEESVLARDLRDLRRRIIVALGHVEACCSCARGHPLPHGRWDGGHCCGGVTSRLFTPDEVASLKAAGTRSRHLRVPADDHAGCVFRGAKGCSLDAEHRPNLCVRYTCPELRRELRARGDLAQIDGLGDELLRTFRKFVEARERRRNDEVFAELLSQGP